MSQTPQETLSPKRAIRLFLFILLFAALFRSYGLFDHWKTNDHYNWGGVSTQVWIHCIKEVPWEISRGRLMTQCWDGKNEIYKNHSPVYLWPLVGITYLLGEGEWVLRLYHLFFSLLNIGLVFLLAREAWPELPRRWVLAAFFQAFFLSGIYFGTHPDNNTELSLVFMLASSWLLLRGHLKSSIGIAVLGGLTGWVAYFQFVPILVWAWAHPKDRRVLVSGWLLAGAVLYLEFAYLLETWNPLGFIYFKLSQGYVKSDTTWEAYLMPLRFLKNFVVSHSRLLGPLFASWALMEFFFGFGRRFWSIRKKRWQALTKEDWVVALVGLAPVVYMIPDYRYAMVHIYNYVFFMPLWALLCTIFFERVLHYGTTGLPNAWSGQKLYVFVTLVVALFYPFGIFQSHLGHDILNSVLLAGTALVFLFWSWRGRIPSQFAYGFLFLAALANFSQVMNYRNEPDLEYSFCQRAREEFARTGQPIQTTERFTFAKGALYCRGIPIEYLSSDQP